MRWPGRQTRCSEDPKTTQQRAVGASLAYKGAMCPLLGRNGFGLEAARRIQVIFFKFAGSRN